MTSLPASSSSPYKWLIVVVMLAAEFMDLLDSSVVNVAGPSLQSSLGSTPLQLQWVIGGYALTLGAGLILGGRLGDRYGRRATFLVGIAAFTITSLLCAVSPSIELLIAFRLLQGTAAAMLLPQGIGLLRENLTGREQATAFGFFGPFYGLSGILGPIIGGLLIDADLAGLGWRTVFLVNIPIGIAAFAVAWRILPRRAGDRTASIDLVGALLVAAASGLLVLPLSQGPDQGWPAWTWISFAASGLGFALFVLQQRRTAARGGSPLVTPSILRKPAFTLGLLGIALYFAGLVGSQLVLTLFLQLGNGFSAGEAGLGNIPLALGSGIGGAVSGAVLTTLLGRGVLQIGAAVQIVGAIVLWFELGAAAPFSIWQIVPGVLISGIGSGLVVAGLFTIILAAVDDGEIGSASGVLAAVQSIAASIGIAVFATAFFGALESSGPVPAYREALVMLGVLLIAFLVLSFLFPAKGRPEDAVPEDETSDAPLAT